MLGGSEVPLTQRMIADALIEDRTLLYAARPDDTTRYHIINASREGEIVVKPETKPAEFTLKGGAEA